MEIQNFDVLADKVKASGTCFRVAVAAAGDSHTIEAVMMAKQSGFVSPILIGDQTAVEKALEELGETVPKDDIIHIPDNAQAAAKAVELVKTGNADFLMKGKLDTPVLLRAVVNKENGLGTGSLMSTFLLAEIPGYHKLLAVVDGGLVPYPTLEQKKGIIQNTVAALRDLGYDSPKVAVLACIEKLNPKMPETVEADALKQMYLSGELQNCIVEGPISYDCAMSPESAEMKGYQSPVVGQCDILIAPNIHTANIMTKMLYITCGAKTAGFIVGAKCPVVMSSRGSTAEEKFMSIVLAAAVVLGHKHAES